MRHGLSGLTVTRVNTLLALTMGNDPAWTESRLVVHVGVSGVDLLRAVRYGRVWLNITRVDHAGRRYRELIDQIAGHVCGFRTDFSQGTPLASSPHALVYDHVDGLASVLWAIRGRKRVWVYPALDQR